MKTENDCRCDKRINQLEEALRNIANGDMRTSRAKAKMALEGTFPPVDEKPDERANKELVGATTPAPTPWSAKSQAYWHEQYQRMGERYWKQIGKNSDQAEHIRELEEHSTAQDVQAIRAMVAHCEGFISNLKEDK
jgi:hypothetical protein